MFQEIFIIEQNILLWIQENLRNEILTPFFVLITSLGNAGIFWILLTIGLLIPKKTRRVGILSASALLLSFLINNVLLKNLIARARPYEVIEGLSYLVRKPIDYSFPSGHTGSSFAAAVVLFLSFPKKYSVWFLVLAFLIGFSRLYVGVHYPSDVLVGALIGTLAAVFVYRIGIKLLNKKTA